jgi:hypothetical protein
MWYVVELEGVSQKGKATSGMLFDVLVVLKASSASAFIAARVMEGMWYSEDGLHFLCFLRNRSVVLIVFWE